MAQYESTKQLMIAASQKACPKAVIALGAILGDLHDPLQKPYLIQMNCFLRAVPQTRFVDLYADPRLADPANFLDGERPNAAGELIFAQDFDNALGAR